MASNPLPPQAPPQATNPPLSMGPPILPKIARRKTIDNPLMPRRPVRRPAESRSSSQSTSIPAKPPLTAATPPPETFDPKDWTACRLVTTKKSLLAGQRHHVMRLHPKQYIQAPDPTDRSGEKTIMMPRRVDVTNPGEFKRPIRLHRRDATAPLGGVMETEAAKLIPQDVEVDKEKEKLDVLKAEKARVKVEQLSKIAPDGGARERKKMAFVKKTQQVHKVVDAANRRMRYEEQVPWFIEDYDNTNTWQGQREHAMSGGTFVVLMFDRDTATFSMIPVEKWYKFTEVRKFKLSEKVILAAEKRRKEAGALPSWVKSEAKKQVFEETEKLTAAELEAYSRNVRIGNSKRIVTSKGQSNKNTAGDEELDYNEERFDDDDAGAVLFFEGNEDEEALKEVEARIKKEQLSANVSDIRTELDYEDEEKKQRKLESLAKAHGKKLAKALKKREGNYTYESDSDKDPYASSEESEDEDELFRKSELKNKEEAVKKEAAEAAKLEAAKQAEAKKDAVKKQRGVANKIKNQEKVKESSAALAVTVPQVVITPAVSKPAGKGKGNENTTLPSADTGGVSKKRRSPTLLESSNDAKKQRQDKVVSGASGSGDMLEVPGKKVWGNKKSPGPSGDNLEVPGGGNKNKNKRKFTGENDGVTKNKRQKPVTPPVEPASTATQPTTPTPSLAIADEEIIALFRAYPEGISIKAMANTFKNRLRTGTDDVAVLAGRLKQFGIADGNKVFRLRAGFV